MGDYRPTDQPFEAAYRSALERIKRLEAQLADLSVLSVRPERIGNSEFPIEHDNDSGAGLAAVDNDTTAVHTPQLPHDATISREDLEEALQYEWNAAVSAVWRRVAEMAKAGTDVVQWANNLEARDIAADHYHARRLLRLDGYHGTTPLSEAGSPTQSASAKKDTLDPPDHAETEPRPITECPFTADNFHPTTDDSLLHPVSQVYFRAGLLACREYMARFVEAESPSIAMSIRANWWPSLGTDFGPPRQLDFAEVTSGEYGAPDFRIKNAEELSPTQEALPVALGFLQQVGRAPDASSAETKPRPHPDRYVSPVTAANWLRGLADKLMGAPLGTMFAISLELWEEPQAGAELLRAGTVQPQEHAVTPSVGASLPNAHSQIASSEPSHE